MIDIKVDTKQLNEMARFVANVTNKMPEKLAASMTFAAFDAQNHLKAKTPSFVDNPTKWTTNSTFVRRASPNKLAVTIGFKDWASKGTPAAKFLQPMVAGEPRGPKRFERALQRRGLLRSNEYVVPADVYPLQLNSFGNLTGATYTQILSRLSALGGAGMGYDGNRSGSRRSRAARRKNDYFLGQPGGLPRGIYARVGTRPDGGGAPRGFHTVFYITSQPQYDKQFPVADIINSKFNERFPSIFERLVFKAKR